MIPIDTLAQNPLKDAKEISALVESILKSLAILIAGAWAYFHYFKGRTFRERLEVNVLGAVQEVNGRGLLYVTTKASNVGLSKVPLPREGSGLRVFTCNSSEVAVGPIATEGWTRLCTVDVFEGHDWIEPGEILQEQQLFALPDGARRMVKVELQVVSKKHKWIARAVTAPNSEGGQDERE